MVKLEARIGPVIGADGTDQELRLSKDGSLVVQDGHAKFMEAVLRGNVYHAATQAGVALTVGISTTATGIILSNPPNSGKRLVLWKLKAALSTAPAGIATIGYEAVVTPQVSDSTHTTPLTARNALIGNTKTPTGKVDSAATLAATPVCVRALPGGPVATGSVTSPDISDNIDGEIILEPGTAISLFALTTAISALLSLTWEEIDISPA